MNELPGVGASVAWSLVSLGLVCLAAWAALRWLARRGLGAGVAGSTRHIRIVARQPLDARRALYLVESGRRVLLIGVGDGPMTVLAELAPEDLPAPATPEAPARFSDVFARVLGRRAPSATIEDGP